MEEYINGTIVSFDGVADSHCVPLFYTSNVFPTRCWTSSVRTATSPTGRRSPCPLR